MLENWVVEVEDELSSANSVIIASNILKLVWLSWQQVLFYSYFLVCEEGGLDSDSHVCFVLKYVHGLLIILFYGLYLEIHMAIPGARERWWDSNRTSTWSFKKWQVSNTIIAEAGFCVFGHSLYIGWSKFKPPSCCDN